jgi:nitric oxide reductase subunit B
MERKSLAKKVIVPMAAELVLFDHHLVRLTTHIWPGFLLNVFNFNSAKIVHIDGLVIWLLMGFLGAVYWFLPQELEREVEGIALAEILFWVFCAAVAVVVVVFVFVQYGSATEASMWFINQGRKYVEAPRWAALGIVAVMGVFAYNVIGTTVKSRKSTGILTVLMFDLIPLVVLYLDAFPEIRNMSEDLFWWWWLVHLWVEATWEVLIGCIMAWTLIHLVGASRRVVESWLYVEVALVLGTWASSGSAITISGSARRATGSQSVDFFRRWNRYRCSGWWYMRCMTRGAIICAPRIVRPSTGRWPRPSEISSAAAYGAS